MTRMQKVALWNIGVMVVAMFATFALAVVYPGTTVCMLAMALMTGLFFGEKIFKGKSSPDWDEMEKQIGRRATIHGYSVFLIVSILTAAFLPMSSMYRASVPVVYIGFIPLFAAYLLHITISLSIFYQSSVEESHVRKTMLVLVALSILSIPPVLTGAKLAEFSISHGLTGTEQRDEWRFSASDNIIATSQITLNTCTQSNAYISLPYANGQIDNASFNGTDVPAEALGQGEYILQLPTAAASGDTLNVLWRFPVDNLNNPNKDNGCPYRTRIRSLIPVKRIWITAVLDEDCGYEVIGSPQDKRWRAVWNCGKKNGRADMVFGSCGLAIQKKQRMENGNG